jgi:ATP-dependent Clp protease protease subunit
VKKIMGDKYMQFKKVDESTTELYIYGEIRKKNIIEKWLGIETDSTDAFTLKDALSKVDTDNLKVRINSMGGSVSEGLAIYSLLSEFKGNLITIVDGFACSAASVIFMAGKKRIIPENGLLMIHNAWSYAEGDSNAMRKAAEDLEKITQPSVNIYVSKTGLSEEEIKEKMDNETWITSKEGFEMGFATTIERYNEAKQSIENHYIHKMVMKLKELENNIGITSKESKDPWDLFFMSKK